MAAHRPYRAAIGLEAAFKVIQEGRGKIFDPNVVDACLRLFKEKNYQLPT
jgi:HD-GYP domain-containing protein (c-di-GMP phosphodiesterase class II)